MVPLVVGAAERAAISRCAAAALRDKSNSRSRNGTREAGPSIASDSALGDRGLRGMDFAERSIANLERRQRRGVGSGVVGFALRAAHSALDRPRFSCDLRSKQFLAAASPSRLGGAWHNLSAGF